MKSVKINGVKPSVVASEVTGAGKTKGERFAEELTEKKMSIELPASVHRAYAALENVDKEKAAEIIKLVKGLK